MNKKMLFSALLLPSLTFVPCKVCAGEKDAVTTLDSIVVTASRTEETMREVTSNVTVIDEEQIKNSSANTLDQLMAQQGFYILNQGGQRLVQIRGMNQPSMGNELESPVLILLNGRRIGANNAALMSLVNVERIEVIRGPSAVQYGSSAMGGVINIITKRGQKDAFHMTTEVGMGSYNLHKEQLSFSGGKNGFDFSGSILNFSRDAYDVSGGKTWEHTDIGRSTAVNVDVGYTFLERHRLGVDFNYYDQNDVESASDGFSNTSAIHNDATYNRYDLNNYNIGFIYDGATADKMFSWFVRYSFGRNENEGSDLPAPSWTQHDTIDTQSFTAQTTYNGEMISVTLGLDYLKYDLDNNGSDSTSENMGGYLATTLRFFDEKLILSAGGRFDDYELEGNNNDKSETNFSPSIGVAYLPLEWLKLRTNYSEGFRMPSPKQFLGEAPWYVAATNLNPEKSKTFELGIDAAWAFATASLTYFHTKWEDKITADWDAVAGGYRYHNLEESIIDGLEFSANMDVAHFFGWNFTLRPYVNVTHLMTIENRDETTIGVMGSDRLTNIPKTTISFGLNFTHPDYDLMANINAYYSSNIFSMDRRNSSPSNGRYITACNGMVVDLSIEKGLWIFNNDSRMKFRLEINNLFDEDNERYLDYPGPGRNVYAGLKYEF